jgi:hypothetical protein
MRCHIRNIRFVKLQGLVWISLVGFVDRLPNLAKPEPKRA